MTDYFLAMRPTFPWSMDSIGLPALAIVAALLVAITVWSYMGHPNANRRRIFIVLVLRLLALFVALVTALRPSIGVQENPKNPSVLLIGVDLSESMSVQDEVNAQARIEAVRKTLEKCQPTLDALASELNVSVQLYRFSTPDFSEGTSRFSLTDPADGKRSDYGAYLNRTFERWQAERFLRGHLIIGDGADNGETFSAVAEAARWGRKGAAITTFTTGSDSVGARTQDIVVTGVTCDPSPVPIKTDVTVIGNVHAYGFVGSRVLARVYFNDVQVKTEEVILERERDNKIRLTVKAPPTKGEVKVRLAIGEEKAEQIVALRGEANPENNQSETYLTVTKDGVRVLVIDRLRWEQTRLRDALRSEARFDVNEVIRQTDGTVTAAEEELLDLDAQAYDVVIIGNVTPEQLRFTRNGREFSVLERLREKVFLNKTPGVMFIGGEHAFRGMPDDLLPVTVPADPAMAIVENVDKDSGRPIQQFQTVPTDEALGKMMKLSTDPARSAAGWTELNTKRRLRPYSRLTGYNRMTPKVGVSTVFAWASPDIEPVPVPHIRKDKSEDGPLLVGWQVGDGNGGRVLAFGGYDTYLWEKLGQPKPLTPTPPETEVPIRNGSEVHSRFWKNCVLWVARQEDEEGQAYARPAQRQLKVGGEQTVRVGVKLPDGSDDPSAELTVKVVPLLPGKAEPELAELERTKPETVVRDKDGAKILLRPRIKGEYFVELTSPKKSPDGTPLLDASGKPQLHRATAKFIVLPDTSDEMMNVRADHDFMSRLSLPNGGKALRLEDLPGFLREMMEQKDIGQKPRPRFYPDWRRNHSQGFLPLWLTIFTTLLGAEWALRRLWGMA